MKTYNFINLSENLMCEFNYNYKTDEGYFSFKVSSEEKIGFKIRTRIDPNIEESITQETIDFIKEMYLDKVLDKIIEYYRDSLSFRIYNLNADDFKIFFNPYFEMCKNEFIKLLELHM